MSNYKKKKMIKWSEKYSWLVIFDERNAHETYGNPNGTKSDRKALDDFRQRNDD